MLSVFRSETTEETIRTGALRQLATMLDDPGLHSAFLADQGLDSICEKLKEMVRKEVTVLTEDTKPVLSSCVMILKLLLRRDSRARERLSRDYELLTSLLRAADLCRLSIASLAEVAVVLALLVFDDILQVYVRPREPADGQKRLEINVCEVLELSLPASVVSRYQVSLHQNTATTS